MLYTDKYQNCLYQLIKMQFPNIKNLQIKETNKKDEFNIIFDNTEYSKQEVENFINEFKNTNNTKHILL